MKAIASFFKSVFHPKTCAACGRIIDENERLCDYCHEMLKRCDPIKRCIKCGLDKKNCQCKKYAFNFNACIAPFKNEGAARNAVYAFKFRRKISAAEFLYEQMALCVRNEYRDIKFDAICFVPMSAKRQLKRGYNQSRVLADGISRILKIPVVPMLYVKASGGTQHSLSKAERFNNVKGIYGADVRARGKKILLVDDIKTTGATLNECAKQLISAGAVGVYCVTALITDKDGKKDKNS